MSQALDCLPQELRRQGKNWIVYSMKKECKNCPRAVHCKGEREDRQIFCRGRDEGGGWGSLLFGEHESDWHRKSMLYLLFVVKLYLNVDGAEETNVPTNVWNESVRDYIRKPCYMYTQGHNHWLLWHFYTGLSFLLFGNVWRAKCTCCLQQPGSSFHYQ